MAIQLRTYQADFRDRVIDLWKNGKRDVLAVMATGAGKTELFLGTLAAEYASGRMSRALILAHRDELIQQAVERIDAHWSQALPWVGIVKAEQDQCDAPLIVASVQSLSRGGRLDRILRTGRISHLVIDEAHHSTADGYTAVIDGLKAANPNLCHLGVTATPFRTDRRAMRHVYEAVAGVADIKRLIDWGYLVPFEALGVQTGISLTGIRTIGEDFDQKALADVFDTDNCFELVVETHRQFASARQALAFTVSVKGAYRLAEVFRAAGFAAEGLDGETPRDERRAILARFKSGVTQIICNCNVLTEGFDHPALSAIHMVAPTKSDLVYVQRLGRALRTAPGKDSALVFDYKPVETRNVVMAGDVLGRIRKEAVRDGLGDLFTPELDDEFEDESPDQPVNWTSGDPQTLTLRALNLIAASPFAWFENGGWHALSVGETDNGMETLVIAPNKGRRQYELWLVTKRPNEYPQRFLVAQHGAMGAVAEKGIAYADQHGQAWAAGQSVAWKRRPASDGQLNLMRNLDIAFADDIRAGEAAARITLEKGRRAVIAGRRFGATSMPIPMAI